jgi:hypothetical protein
MKVTQRFVYRLCSGLCLLSLAAGCAFIPKDNITNTTTDYNLVVEKVQNEMLLLNIVRASKRRPMYFTSFNLMRGSMAYNLQTGSMNIPFGRIGAGAGLYTITSPSASYTTSPSFDIGVLDSKEFMVGLLTNVPMETFKYYWDQRWSKEMLLHICC